MPRSTTQAVTITVDTENTDATHAAWWLVVDANSRGVDAVVAGPFFSRPEAQAWLDTFGARKTTRYQVWALPGRGQYRHALEAVMRAEATD